MSDINEEFLITLNNLTIFKEELDKELNKLQNLINNENLFNAGENDGSIVQALDGLNKAFAPKSASFGSNSVAGSMAYEIDIDHSDIDAFSFAIYLNENEFLSDDIINQEITIIYRNDFIFTKCGIVTSYIGNNITIAPDTKVEYPTRMPNENCTGAYLKFINRPDIGNVYLGTAAFATGYETKATDTAALSGGDGAIADASNGVSLGRNTYAGYAASAFGGENKAVARFSSAENYGNKIYAEKAHGEGDQNIIGKTAYAAHVEGGQNRIRENGAPLVINHGFNHVEGYKNTDNGDFSHIENANNTIENDAVRAHAGGYNVTIKSGAHEGFGHGQGLTVNHRHEAVFGRYNDETEVTDTNIKNLFEIGNGTTSAKSNAFRVDEKGNAFIQTAGYIGGAGENNKIATVGDIPNEISLDGYATEEYVNNLIPDYNGTNKNAQFIMINADNTLSAVSIQIGGSY